MRPLALACIVLIVAVARDVSAQRGIYPPKSQYEPIYQPVDDARIDRLARWLEALDGHQPGARDEAVAEVGSWSASEVSQLRMDALSLAALIADPRADRFIIRVEGGNPIRVGYTDAQRMRLRTLACAAGGTLDRCAGVQSPRLTDALQPLASHAAAARQDGDRNYILYRGALLHTDVIVLTGIGFGGAVTIQFADGQLTGLTSGSEHRDLAASLLDRVLPSAGDRPAPARDPIVRDWYAATSAWLEANDWHSTTHLDRARELFPNDADILLVSGCQHESYATPAVHLPLEAALKRRPLTVPVDSPPHELRQAERLFRRALAVNPRMSAARVRLAHVLLEQGQFAEAVQIASQVLTEQAETDVRYLAELVAGTAAEATEQYDAARDAYARASELYPTAQSPYVALSELEWRRSDHQAARRALERTLTSRDRRHDPWWSYRACGVHDPEAALELFRRHFRTGTIR